MPAGRVKERFLAGTSIESLAQELQVSKAALENPAEKLGNDRMTSLREAREKGKLDQFIKEREGEQGDEAALDRTVTTMAGKSSEARPASSRPQSRRLKRYSASFAYFQRCLPET